VCFKSKVRNTVHSVLKLASNVLVSLARVSTIEFTVAFWPMVAALIPDAAHQSQKCEETFTLCHQLFKKLAETSLDFLNLEELISQWGGLLLSHSPIEVSHGLLRSRHNALTSWQRVGSPESIDLVAQGLANLLYCAASFAKASQQPLPRR
jgi:ubiquitin carboxyl-terminal hydrolase 34